MRAKIFYMGKVLDASTEAAMWMGEKAIGWRDALGYGVGPKHVGS